MVKVMHRYCGKIGPVDMGSDRRVDSVEGEASIEKAPFTFANGGGVDGASELTNFRGCAVMS